MSSLDFNSWLSQLSELTPQQIEILEKAVAALKNGPTPSAAVPDEMASEMPEVAAGNIVKIYTDGACSGNPGPGGWGATLIFGDKRRDLKGGDYETTNNRMEVLAAIEALEALKKPCKVELWTDSTYLRKGITEWIHGWKRNGWKTAAKKPVKNADLWQRLDEIRKTHDVDWHWVKGHAGHPENERADELARAGMEPYK